MMAFLAKLFSFILLVCYFARACEKPKPENALTRLFKELLCDYDSRIRPVVNISTTTHVSTNFSPFFIFIDEEKDVLHVAGHLVMMWVDEFLTWDPKWYDGIVSVSDKSLDIWVPEIVSFDKGIKMYEGEDVDGFKQRYVEISNTGFVIMHGHLFLTGYCKSDLTYWPLNKVNCSMLLGSPEHRNDQVNFHHKNMNLSNAIDATAFLREDREWKLDNWTISLQSFQYLDPNKPNETADVEYILRYEFIISRHTFLYWATYIWPGIILSSMSIIPFWLGPNCTYRLIVHLITFLSQSIYLQNLNMQLRNNGSKKILLVCFFRDSLFVNVIGIFVTLLNYNLLSKPPKSSQMIMGYINAVTNIPYIGPIVVFFMNEDEEMNVADEETSLIDATKERNKNWRKITNLVDKTIFSLLFLGIAIMWIMLLP